MAEITWIKLKTDMFDDEKIKIIERMPEGDGILVVWVKLLAYAGKVNCSGYIMIAEDIPMNIEEMAIIFNRPLEKVRYAIQVLQRYRMIEVDENERICISNWEKHQNIDGMEKVRLQTAERNRKYRERKKQQALQAPNDASQELASDVSVTSRDGIEVEVDIEEDKELKRSSTTATKPSPPVSIITFFQENVRFNLSPFELETIIHWENEYSYELIIEAMKRTALANATALRYTEGILIDWQKKRLTTLAEVERDDAAFNQKKGAKRNESNPRSRQSPGGTEQDNYSL
ncbi:phage replisome organizer N-terminal domain-containing protein [Solibacillus sp. MA9]|uniref:Phage replisome organizer N-terminal domain-containing protein n=1 Tax=Solibacillus palustris TaxID=2908203 RepID=A0ABS9UBN4_9BACL|nr:phage replisome organizer N-terminal domain-containing protein [Solibacillus sp. MA9]MCH7321755.1 phage replisome organizer N-terminal domain-containing protein [Solibacillus sp. MA9]